MKKVLFILTVLLSPLFTEAQVIHWDNFNERHMDTVMFNTMNSYIYYGYNGHEGDYLIWSPFVQKEIMPSNYDVIRGGTHRDIHSLHNMKWGSPTGLDDTLKNKIIEEGVNPIFLDGQKYTYNDSKGNTLEAYGSFDYTEILISVPRSTCQTYQEIARHSIDTWNKSTEGHAGIMNANYKKKVIVGTITFYCKKTHRVFISFVYVH